MYRYFRCNFPLRTLQNDKIIKLAKVLIRPDDWCYLKSFNRFFNLINFTVVSGLTWTFVSFIIWNAIEGQFSTISNNNSNDNCMIWDSCSAFVHLNCEFVGTYLTPCIQLWLDISDNCWYFEMHLWQLAEHVHFFFMQLIFLLSLC